MYFLRLSLLVCKRIVCLCGDQIQQRLSELWPVRIFTQHPDSKLRRKVMLFLAELRDSILCYREKHLCVGVVCKKICVARDISLNMDQS